MSQKLSSVFIGAVALVICCGEPVNVPSKEAISAIKLKTGTLISCGPADKEFGEATMSISCGTGSNDKFNLGLRMLHSFEYDEAEKVFAEIIGSDPACAMSYWGVAMSNFHPLWNPPTQDELTKGHKAISIAQSLPNISNLEKGFINAAASFYNDWDKVNHYDRCLRFERVSGKVYDANKDNTEATAFYALSLLAAADPADKTYARQKKAGSLLESLYTKFPDHPGVVHYMIHAYDAPALASAAVEVANRYASVAPSSAHALHMPSHIFIRLGRWDESISSNLASVEAAKCYGESSGIKGHWDEELHGLDYLVYAYLQKGDKQNAEKLVKYMNSMQEINPVNFKVAYAMAASTSRYVLENRLWNEAAELDFPAIVPWDKFPWQKSILHFTRTMGMVHSGKIDAAKAELRKLSDIHDMFVQQKNNYHATQVEIQKTIAEAWIHLMQRDFDKAKSLMKTAAELENKTEKHPVTPGEVLPAQELLGDLLVRMGSYSEALAAYNENLESHPNRLNGLIGAAKCADQMGDKTMAKNYYSRIAEVTGNNGQRAY